MNLNDWNTSSFEQFEFSINLGNESHTKEYGFRIFKFKAPLKAGEEMDFNVK